MSQALRMALFVEGSEAPPSPRKELPALHRIWNGLAESLGLRCFDPIIPISKKHLVAMDPSLPKMSGSAEPLDQLMARTLRRAPFDAAIIAWDLVPAWNTDASYCRWQETLDLYRYLAASEALSGPWVRCAERRLAELEGRDRPSLRDGVPTREPGAVLALCMEPMFEGLLTVDEAAIRRAVDVGARPQGWPTHGWGDRREHKTDTRVLGPAIRALFGLRPRPKILRKIRGDFRTHKDEWGEYLLRQLLRDPKARPWIAGHPLTLRLCEIAR